MKRVGIALVGLGGWGGGAGISAALAARYIRVVTWFDSNPEVIEQFRERIPVPPSASYEELLCNTEVEGVALFVPNHVHAPLAVQAAKFGKHVWIEKPIANTIAEADSIIEACKNSGVVLQVGHSIRRLPPIRRAKQMILEGAIGELVLAEGHHSHRGGWSLTAETWRSYNDKCPGGPMNVLGIHQIDCMHYLIGSSVEVTGMMTKRFREYEADEITAIIIHFENNCLGAISASYVSPAKTFVSIYGTTGYIECDLRLGTLTHYDVESKRTRVRFPRRNVVADELTEFANCIRTGAKPETGGHEARSAVAVLEAAIQSARTGKCVRIVSARKDSL